jgi:glycosidase
MRWAEHSIWWHVYPLGFSGAPLRDRQDGDDAGGGLTQLQEWLPYAVELGANGLLLGPVFASQTHGYDTVDHLRIDPRLGGEEDFDRLIEACRERGLRVVLDGVFNHVSREHRWFREALAEGPEGAAGGRFRLDWSDPDSPQAQVFEGHGELVTLDHTSPQVARDVAEIMNHWLDRGVDGWRLDAAYAMDPGFWAGVLPVVRERHPDAWIVGEVIHGDYAKIVEASGMDSVTQYELWKAIWSSIHDHNFFELDWALQRHNEFVAQFTPHTFIGNHDVTRIASQVGHGGAVLALTVLMTVAGIPSIYYGDEQGFTGIKEDRIGGDDAVRPRFPADPGSLGEDGMRMYRVHQDLIGLRRRHPWLVTANTSAISLANTRYEYETRSADGTQRLRVVLDLGDEPRAEVHSDAAPLFSWG